MLDKCLGNIVTDEICANNRAFVTICRLSIISRSLVAIVYI